MTIRLLNIQDIKKLEEYLAPHKSECMFICSNLKEVGIEYKGAAFQGEYFGHFSDSLEQLDGVIAHYWNGNVMMHASDQTILEQLVIHLRNKTKRSIAGVLGPNIQAEYVIKNLGLSYANFSINRNEGLYGIDLETLNELDILNNFDIVSTKEVSKDLLIKWMKSYDIEALGASNDDDLEKQVEEHWNNHLQKNDSWVLLSDGTPVSLSAFNARLDDMVQIGPVWTPPEHRNKGFARLLLRYTLVQEKRKGTKKAILFTDNPAAIKAYQAIGFAKIGDYRLALLEKPIILQEKSKNIEVVPYDSNWPRIFETEAALISQALGDNCLEVHHVGSTSVPGLSAKPKIDIIAVVKSGEASIGSLEKADLTYRGEFNIPCQFGFTKRGKNKVNLHVFEENHPEIDLNLMFRDYLRSHPQVRDDYARLKEDLLKDQSSFMRENSHFAKYTLRKGDFIRGVLKEAGFNRMRILKCNDNTEWAAAKNFRDKYFFGPHGIDDPYTWTFNHPEHAHLAFYQGTEIIGYVHIQFWPESRAAIRIIAVDDDKRGQNAGSQFLTLTEKWLKGLKIKSIHAESRATSLGFYRKNGYLDMPFNDPESHEHDPNDIPVGKVL
jgi:GrpB-like predicted nucleotidyltransferase (UPF0157 family)/predicted GNAT family acetyltransferase